MLIVVVTSIDHDVESVCMAAPGDAEGMVITAVMAEVVIEIVLMCGEAVQTRLKGAGKSFLSLLPVVLTFQLLSSATKRNYADTVQMLLHCGVPPDFAWQDEPPALMIAARRGYTLIARSLIQAGASPTRPFDDVTPLFAAISSNSIGVVKELIQCGVAINDDANNGSNGRTPLLHALTVSDMEMIELLVKAGARVGVPPDSPVFLEALAQAAQSSKPEAVARLMSLSTTAASTANTSESLAVLHTWA